LTALVISCLLVVMSFTAASDKKAARFQSRYMGRLRATGGHIPEQVRARRGAEEGPSGI
jgi:hypothetical protein